MRGKKVVDEHGALGSRNVRSERPTRQRPRGEFGLEDGGACSTEPALAQCHGRGAIQSPARLVPTAKCWIDRPLATSTPWRMLIWSATYRRTQKRAFPVVAIVPDAGQLGLLPPSAVALPPELQGAPGQPGDLSLERLENIDADGARELVVLAATREVRRNRLTVRTALDSLDLSQVRTVGSGPPLRQLARS